MEVKKCSKCGEWKEVGEFYQDRRYVLGVKGQCKTCMGITDKKWKQRNPEKVRQIGRKSWDKHRKERLMKLSENNKGRYREHREEILGRSHVYYQENKTKVNEYWKRFRSNNKPKIRQRKKKAWAELQGWILRGHLKREFGFCDQEMIEQKRQLLMKHRLIKQAIRGTNESTGNRDQGN